MACGCIRGRHGYIDIQTQTPGLRSNAAVSPCRARPSASGLLDRIAAAADPEALTIAQHYKSLKSPIPGFGHHLHKPVDPRAYKLLDLARAEPELAGNKIRALEQLSAAVDEIAGRAITINATGAVAALLGEIGVPTAVMRGFAVISRAAGLVAHIVEEQSSPSGRFIWETVEGAVPSVGMTSSSED